METNIEGFEVQVNNQPVWVSDALNHHITTDKAAIIHRHTRCQYFIGMNADKNRARLATLEDFKNGWHHCEKCWKPTVQNIRAMVAQSVKEKVR